MSELHAEDQKLITLARTARARTSAAQGAAVRDSDGRTYVATTIALRSLGLSALQLAVAMSISSGGRDLEAAAIVGAPPVDDAPGRAALAEVAPAASVHLADSDGTLIDT